MRPVADTLLQATPLSASSSRSLSDKAMDYLEMAKPRLTGLVLLSVMAGYLMAVEQGAINVATLLHLFMGVTLIAAGAGIFNQIAERHLDSQMLRTQNRPLPTGRISPQEAFWVASIAAATGFLLLLLFVNKLTAILGAVVLLTYVFVYTPLKVRSTFNTLVGAITGALPPVMGWAAASGSIGENGWILFAILYLWQLPHFFALAWWYRDDYRRAGIKMISVEDSDDGRMTFRLISHFSLVLLPVSLLPSLRGFAGPTYLIIALLCGLTFFASAVWLNMTRTRKAAWMVFIVSVIYLPIILTVMVLDKIV